MSAPAQKTVDADPEETREWLEALEAVVKRHGKARGVFLLSQLEEQGASAGHPDACIAVLLVTEIPSRSISRPCIG